mmetsp:Transcript_16748/g.24760  ORF Transcript_16748/g.24760 Transcript_16748/m.24760 type:complete len:270 (+) Transcript_16748:203-1012(+)
MNLFMGNENPLLINTEDDNQKIALDIFTQDTTKLLERARYETSVSGKTRNGKRKIEQASRIEKIDWQKRCGDIVKDYQKMIMESHNKLSINHQNQQQKEHKKTSHSAQWFFSFQKLLRFRKQHGHCHVPCVYNADPSLARWVKRQRYHYYLYANGKQSPIKCDRIEKLEEIGFIWHAQEALWQDRLNELLSFKKMYGHCVVPTNYPENQTLATWVKFQRRQHKLHEQGRPSYMSAARIAVLEKHGFEWKLRSSSSSKSQPAKKTLGKSS